MSIRAKKYMSLPVAICFMVVTFSFLFPVGGTAEDAVAPESPVAYVRSLSGTIELKKHSSVVIMERSYSVTEETVILNEKNEVIPFSKLPTPCEAVIEFQLRMDQDPLCLKISVKKPKKKSRSRKE